MSIDELKAHAKRRAQRAKLQAMIDDPSISKARLHAIYCNAYYHALSNHRKETKFQRSMARLQAKIDGTYVPHYKRESK